MYYLEKISWLEWLLLSLISNVFLYLFSIGLYLFIDKTCSKDKIQEADHPFSKSDLYLSFITVFINALVMLIGVFLWKFQLIQLNNNKSVITIILEIAIITLVMDLLMYFFHYFAHIPLIYKIIHQKHHEHISTNQLSLFVLHPFETFGFGALMLLVFIIYPFSMISIITYLILNLTWGTIGHLNREFFPNWAQKIYIGTSKFHNQHHLNNQKNFGFYTSIWDRILGTYMSEN